LQHNKAVGGGGFKICLSDNIGGFKLMELFAVGARMASTGGGAPTAVAGTPTTEILTLTVSEVLTIIVVFRCEKFIYWSPSYGSAGISF
jgi:hypothetical protein